MHCCVCRVPAGVGPPTEARGSWRRNDEQVPEDPRDQPKVVGDAGSLVPDRNRWPSGRTGLITSGELAGMWALVYPETAGRWVVYVSGEPSGEEAPHLEDWGLSDDEALLLALEDLDLVWVAPADEEVRVERRVFGLRDQWRREGREFGAPVTPNGRVGREKGPLVRAFADSWDAPRPARLSRMSDRTTGWVMGVTVASLLLADLGGWWSLALWWNAMADWAPVGVVVTVVMVLGWQSALTHALLGAFEYLRCERVSPGSSWAAWANFVLNSALWLAWWGSCLVYPGLA